MSMNVCVCFYSRHLLVISLYVHHCRPAILRHRLTITHIGRLLIGRLLKG